MIYKCICCICKSPFFSQSAKIGMFTLTVLPRQPRPLVRELESYYCSLPPLIKVRFPQQSLSYHDTYIAWRHKNRLHKSSDTWLSRLRWILFGFQVPILLTPGLLRNLSTQGERDVPRYVPRVTRGEEVFNENYFDSFFIKWLQPRNNTCCLFL